MEKIIVFGNSGSGKSTMAKSLCQEFGLAHLDLDNLAWLPQNPPERRPLTDAKIDIVQFIESESSWVIEGCYADLLAIAAKSANKIIYLNLPIKTCIKNAKNRAWEPHKYKSKEAQDANLKMLLNWIENYRNRADDCSAGAHQQLYNNFAGEKQHIVTMNDI